MMRASLGEPRVSAGEGLLAAGDAGSAIRAFQQAVYLNPDSYEAHVGLARAFLSCGFDDNAIEHFRRAALLRPLSLAEAQDLADAIRARDQRRFKLRHATEVFGKRTLRFLGVGWEGANYVVREPDGSRSVVKLFHPAFVRLINFAGAGGIYRQPVASAAGDIRRMADGPAGGGHALYCARPIEIDKRIVAITYRYEYLIPIGWRCLQARSVRPALLATFCCTQAYLLRTFALTLSDAWASRQFMFTLDGRLRYVDYGTTIVPVDDFRCREDHWEVLVVIDILFSVFAPQHEALLIGASAAQAAGRTGVLGAETRRVPLARELLRHLESGKWEAFLDADFYRHLARNVCTDVGILPRLAGSAANLRRRVRQLGVA